jgi:hypothetical protein
MDRPEYWAHCRDDDGNKFLIPVYDPKQPIVFRIPSVIFGVSKEVPPSIDHPDFPLGTDHAPTAVM